MNVPPSTTGPLGQPRGVGFGILMYIVTLYFYSWYWVYKTQEEIKQHSGIGVGGVLGLVIWVLLGIVTIFLVPSDIGKMFKADGQEAPFSGWLGLWHFLPIIGSIIWFVKVQNALNHYWETKAGTAPAAVEPAAA